MSLLQIDMSRFLGEQRPAQEMDSKSMFSRSYVASDHGVGARLRIGPVSSAMNSSCCTVSMGLASRSLQGPSSKQRHVKSRDCLEPGPQYSRTQFEASPSGPFELSVGQVIMEQWRCDLFLGVGNPGTVVFLGVRTTAKRREMLK